MQEIAAPTSLAYPPHRRQSESTAHLSPVSEGSAIKLAPIIARLLLLAAAALFLLRGPLRSHSNYVNDFAAPYASARLWIHHQNPYNPAAFFPTWRAAGAPDGPVYANPSSTQPVYPPPSLFVLLPLALLPWPFASIALTLLTTTAYLGAALLFTRCIPGSWRGPAKPLFLAYALALAPVHSAMHVSNLACLSASLLFVSLYRLLVSSTPDLSANPRPAELNALSPTPNLDLTTASLLTLSLCLKPTLAPLALLFLISRQHWKTLAATLALGLTVCAASLYPLLHQGPQWFTDLRGNLHFVFTQGTANLSETNLTRFDRIDLQLPLYALTQSRTAAALLAALLAAALLLVWAFTPLRNRLRPASPPPPLCAASFDDTLLRLSTLLILGLLPFYQRFYSAILLLPLALWSFRNLASPSMPSEPLSQNPATLEGMGHTCRMATFAPWTLALCCLFLVNTEVLQQQIGLVPAGALHLPWFHNVIVGPHLNWILLLSATALLLLQYPQAKRTSIPATHEMKPNL